jgi:hypothetical protein
MAMCQSYAHMQYVAYGSADRMDSSIGHPHRFTRIRNDVRTGRYARVETMRKIVGYDTVDGDYLDISKNVQLAINKGWEPFGSLVTDERRKYGLIQPIVKYEEKIKRPIENADGALVGYEEN